MAGEIEEPFRMKFQADSIHSGSISFGRFETEALCWERRSSFSHNRYLEEVEKCSKPGSVIEKKAYFEVHFRKKRILGILGHSSPDSLNEKDYQTSDNGVSDNHSEIDHMSDENLSVRFEPRSETDASDRHSAEIDNLSAENHSARYSERPIGAAYGVELEVSQFESEVFGTSISEPQIEIACQNTEDVDPAAENFKVEESNNAVVGDLHPSDSTLGFGLEEKPNGEARGLNQIGLCIIDYDAAVNSCTSPEEQQGSSIKEKAPPVPKCTKTRLTPRLGVAKSRKNISSKELKGSKSKAEEKEKLSEVKPRTKTDMKCSEASTPNKYQICKTPKNEPTSRTKGIDRIRSAGKESGRVAVSDPQFSTIKKAPIRMNQSAIRSKPTTGEPKPRMNQDGSKSGLRCNEPAQKRGQFSIRLEEKVHKNKTKTQHLHAKTQEKKTEIKQLSKSLNLNKSRNFKAKPLPSFYHGALSESDRNKGTLNSVKPRKSQTDLLSAGTRVGTRMIPPTTPSSLQEPKEPCDIRLASGATSCHSTVTSDSNSSSPAAGNGNNHLSTCEINRLVGVKKDFKEKRMGLSKNKVAEANGRTIDVKQKTRTGRTTTYAACKK